MWKTNKYLVIVLAMTAILSFGFVGCKSGKHPVDVTYPVLETGNKSWDIANKFAIGVHDLCVAQGAQCPFPQIVTEWNKFDNLADQIDDKFDQLEGVWIQLGKPDYSPDDVTTLQNLIKELNVLLDQIIAMIPGLGGNAKITPMELQQLPDGRLVIKQWEVANAQ